MGYPRRWPGRVTGWPARVRFTGNAPVMKRVLRLPGLLIGLAAGIKLTPRSWHPISARLMVVEEDATWPESTAPARVATVFRVAGDKVTASLRLPDLKSALDLAYICREMAATE